MNSQQLRREGSAASLLCDSNSVSDSVLDGIGAKKRRRHAFQTRTALLLSGTTVCLLALFALFSSSDHAAFSWFAADERQGRALEEDQDDNDDYSSYSCSDILATTQDGSAARCAFARTCNGGDGVFAPVVFCSAHGKGWLAAMAPFLLLWLVLLFRLLGSTAEDYFSPSLEMFSLRLGLPPRFAGVSLLALGNGAADVSATINAITADPTNGYKLSLGALTGAGMFIGTVVAGLVIVTAGGVPCRGALVRDLVFFVLAIALVWTELSTGYIGRRAISLFFSLYILFVAVVLIADIYHRAIVLPRILQRDLQKERQRQLEEGDQAQSAATSSANLPPSQQQQQQQQMDPNNYNGGMELDAYGLPKTRTTGLLSNVLTSLSNYTEQSVDQEDGWGMTGDEGGDRPVILRGTNGILHHHHILGHHKNNTHGNMSPSASVTGGGTNDSYFPSSPYRAMTEDAAEMEDMGVILHPDDANNFSATNWRGAWHDGTQELKVHWKECRDDIFENEDNSRLDVFLLTCELPFTIMRKVTISIPCEGYYCRALVALSIFLSPLWFGVYFQVSHDMNIFNGVYLWVMFMVSTIVGALVLRYSPGGNGNMPLSAAVPIAFYGFIVAATWIDFIADQLVSLLAFVGIVSKIPSSVMGLTILAWGNSMADLSANLTMARKGLANMAMTACFAGPVFNILIGLAWGFSALESETGELDHAVQVSASVVTGFVFLLANCLLVVLCGVFWYKGTIPKYYGYVALGLYITYIVTSISLQFSRYKDSNNNN